MPRTVVHHAFEVFIAVAQLPHCRISRPHSILIARKQQTVPGEFFDRDAGSL
jgi:hypothetical protein